MTLNTAQPLWSARAQLADESGPRRLLPATSALRAAHVLVLVGATAVAFGLSRQPERTWTNLLIDDFYLLSAALGGVLFISIQHLAGAGWCAGLRRIAEAMMAALAPAAVLMLALYLGRHSLYRWSEPGALAAEGVTAAKAAYLSTPFVFLRMLVVLVLWVLLATRMRRISLRQDKDPSPRHHRSLVRHSAVFAVLLGPTLLLGSFDWLMSLDPRWFSTIFAVYVFAGLFVLGLAVVTLATLLLSERGDLAGVVDENHLHDLGKLLFAFSTFWAYIWVSQYLLIWYGNIPEEISHYLKRTSPPWSGLFLLNLVLNWLVPFLVLMSRAAKRNRAALKLVCVVVLAGRWLDLYLMVAPELSSGPAIGPLEVLIFAGYGGMFVAIVLRSLARAPLLALNDPYLEESLRHRQ